MAPPPASKNGRGCLIAAAVVGVAAVLVVAVVAYGIWRVGSEVSEAIDGVTIGDVDCPTEEEVSDLVGDDVDLVLSGSIIIAAGCNYTSVSGTGVGVTITEGAGLIADDVLDDLRTTAETYGTTAEPIGVGRDGLAFDSPSRAEAAARIDGHIVGVEVFSEGTDDIGDQRDAAVRLLEMFAELND